MKDGQIKEIKFNLEKIKEICKDQHGAKSYAAFQVTEITKEINRILTEARENV